MPTNVRVHERVLVFQRALSPVPRRAMKAALAGLAQGRGDVKALEDELDGLYRLRVGVHRIIFYYTADGAARCFFVERRAVVYEMLAASMADLLAED